MTNETIALMVRRGTCPTCGAKLRRDGQRRVCTYAGGYRTAACDFVWPRTP